MLLNSLNGSQISTLATGSQFAVNIKRNSIAATAPTPPNACSIIRYLNRFGAATITINDDENDEHEDENKDEDEDEDAITRMIIVELMMISASHKVASTHFFTSSIIATSVFSC